MEDTLNNQNLQNNQSNPPSNVPFEFNKQNPNEQREDLEAVWLRWRCMVCGYVYEGATQLKECPRCGNNNPDKFDDVD
jgi:rubrerythrin